MPIVRGGAVASLMSTFHRLDGVLRGENFEKIPNSTKTFLAAAKPLFLANADRPPVGVICRFSTQKYLADEWTWEITEQATIAIGMPLPRETIEWFPLLTPCHFFAAG